MVRVIEPQVDFLSYGPTVKLIDEEKNETIISPDDLVYGAAGVTFKGMNFINDVIDLKKEGIDFQEKRDKAIIKSVGAGHASMSTSMGFWTILQGGCSKLVDSIFTGATYVSALMPSGRRVPISEEEIVVPQGIADKGGKLLDLFLDVSKKNIQAYEALQNNGVPKQEASKIVQYSHSGGGFLFMPIETLVYFSKLAESNPDDMPLEGREIIAQLEKIVHQNGMGVVYESRKNAPRASNVNPNIFHHRTTWAQEVFEGGNFYLEPAIISESDALPELRDARIGKYLSNRKKLFEDVGNNWKDSLRELEDIVADYNDSVNVQTMVNTPWRVWGEVKRHRTLSQNAGSIYLAMQKIMGGNFYPIEMKKFMSIPESVSDNWANDSLWGVRFYDSIETYQILIEGGIKESDAIGIVPRGIKFPVIKNFDLYNLTTGYASLRQCVGTVEPEMRAITGKEMEMIKESEIIGDDVKRLIAPKCHYGGFCPESDYKKCCGLVKAVVPNYNEEMHKNIWAQREGEIRAEIQKYK
ncbi:MAG: hypothetical protein WC979_10315 [Candidatus Pacearchaeota archaeon]|jgi:hypothetical protein